MTYNSLIPCAIKYYKYIKVPQINVGVATIRLKLTQKYGLTKNAETGIILSLTLTLYFRFRSNLLDLSQWTKNRKAEDNYDCGASQTPPFFGI